MTLKLCLATFKSTNIAGSRNIDADYNKRSRYD